MHEHDVKPHTVDKGFGEKHAFASLDDLAKEYLRIMDNSTSPGHWFRTCGGGNLRDQMSSKTYWNSTKVKSEFAADTELPEEKKEEVTLTKDDVVKYLVDEGYANNEVSAEILHTHISDEFLEEIENKMLSTDKEV